MNPFEFLKRYFTKGMTAKGFVKSKIGNNPILNNLANMVEQGKTKEVETFVRNVFKEKGIDYDKQYENMKKTLNF